MTFEEIQKTIEGMLAVQRQLQERQIQLQESQFEFRERQLQFQDAQEQLKDAQEQLKDAQERERETLQIMIEEINQFIARSNRNERRIEQLIGYSITNESEHLDIEQRFRNLETRLEQLENPS